MPLEPDAQQQHWDKMLSHYADLYGGDPSDPARKAAALFRKEGVRQLLELGGGQGRDTLFFAREGFSVDVLDYSGSAIRAIRDKAVRLALSDIVRPRRHDVREKLPFDDETFDACYSHMLFCMALSSSEIDRLAREVRRVLCPNGLHVYTVRHTSDPHYGKGTHRGEDMYEVDGFIVHFFSREMIGRLAEGYDLIGIDAFEEGELPRKLFRVTMRKR